MQKFRLKSSNCTAYFWDDSNQSFNKLKTIFGEKLIRGGERLYIAAPEGSQIVEPLSWIVFWEEPIQAKDWSIYTEQEFSLRFEEVEDETQPSSGNTGSSWD